MTTPELDRLAAELAGHAGSVAPLEKDVVLRALGTLLAAVQGLAAAPAVAASAAAKASQAAAPAVSQAAAPAKTPARRH